MPPEYSLARNLAAWHNSLVQHGVPGFEPVDEEFGSESSMAVIKAIQASIGDVVNRLKKSAVASAQFCVTLSSVPGSRMIRRNSAPPGAADAVSLDNIQSVMGDALTRLADAMRDIEADSAYRLDAYTTAAAAAQEHAHNVISLIAVINMLGHSFPEPMRRSMDDMKFSAMEYLGNDAPAPTLFMYESELPF